jgi:hypothetical protein
MDEHRANRGIEEAAGLGADAGFLREVVEQALTTAQADRARFWLAIVYPAAVSCLAILGMVWTTATNDRLIRDLDVSFREPPTPAVQTGWSPMLPAAAVLAGVGIALAGVLAAWMMRLGRSVGCHASKIVRSEVLGELEATAASPADRKRLVTEILRSIGSVVPITESDSPLIEAAEHEADIDQRATNLRATAGFYRSLDARARRKAGRLVPIVGSLIAGLAVLFYGVALFGPMAGLFESLAVAHDPIGGATP